MHGYIELFVHGKWVKATPAFNKDLCHKFGVEVLEFNGIDDSIFQAYDSDGRHYMEYLADYGQFEDVPRLFIIERLVATYPHLKSLIESGQWITRARAKSI